LKKIAIVPTALTAVVLAGCGGGGSSVPANALPEGVTQVSVVAYSATAPGAGTSAATQDLLTGGLGKTGIGAAAAPAYADPLNPTAMELRRNTIYSNYRAIVDPSANGGYGTLYGPNVNVSGTATTSEGLIPGKEYLAYVDDGSGNKKSTIAVQVPDSFDVNAPCLVLGPSSGSRGVYGAIATSSDWGLKHNCAVALTDAGKGVGLYDMMDDTVNRIDGTRATRSAAGALSNFAAVISDAARSAYNALFPNRVALKQVHSQKNPEKDWGSDTLVAARYALYAMNDAIGLPAGAPVRFNAANTVVIAGSVSNGGAAVIRAAELDSTGLIDAVVAGEPVTEVGTSSGYGITVGSTALGTYGKTLADWVTFGNLYQPCAALAAPAALTEIDFFNFITFAAMTGRATARCTGLAAKGLVSGADTAAQSLDALNKLRNFGWTTDNDQMHNAMYGLGNNPILSAMYPTSYGRFAVTDNVCNTSYAQVNATGDVVPLTASVKAQSFALANGTANGTPASVVYNDSVGGAKAWQFAVSASTGVADFGLDNAICLRALVTGADPVTGAALTATSFPTKAQSDAVRAGVNETLLNGNMQGKPAIIVTGRSDGLVPLNDNSRAYVAYNHVKDTGNNTRYIEVQNAQHFDTFIPLSGFDTRFVPLHVYWVRAMDAMWSNLKNGTALPASQVVRTTPRGGAPGAAPAISAGNVPPISATPSAADAITFNGTSMVVPN
jgi:hydroxybutyrate-dimer hydrolase